MTRPSIFESAGGAPAFAALAAANHERCLADPELEHAFSHGGKDDHLDRLAAYWGEVFGGPPVYSQAFGGHSAMVDVHAGEGIGHDWSQRFVACFVQAADDAGLPRRPRAPGRPARVHGVGDRRARALRAGRFGRAARDGDAALVVGRPRARLGARRRGGPERGADSREAPAHPAGGARRRRRREAPRRRAVRQ